MTSDPIYVTFKRSKDDIKAHQVLSEHIREVVRNVNMPEFERSQLLQYLTRNSFMWASVDGGLTGRMENRLKELQEVA